MDNQIPLHYHHIHHGVIIIIITLIYRVIMMVNIPGSLTPNEDH